MMNLNQYKIHHLKDSHHKLLVTFENYQTVFALIPEPKGRSVVTEQTTYL